MEKNEKIDTVIPILWQNMGSIGRMNVIRNPNLYHTGSIIGSEYVFESEKAILTSTVNVENFNFTFETDDLSNLKKELKRVKKQMKNCKNYFELGNLRDREISLRKEIKNW